MIVRRPPRIRRGRAVRILYELYTDLGAGSGNKISFQRWHDRYTPGKKPKAARRQWERLRKTLEALGAPVHPEQDGREVYLVLDPGIEQFIHTHEEQLAKYAQRKGAAMFDGSTYREIDIDDIEPQKELPRQEVESMKASITLVGLIHAPVVVGDAPPYQLGLGHRRYWACKELGWKKLPVRVVRHWHPLFEVEEELVRRVYGAVELKNLRRSRKEKIAELRAQGKTNVQIGKELGIDESRVRRCPVSAGAETGQGEVKRSDGKPYPSGRLTPAAEEQRRRDVEDLHAQKKTVREIADVLKIRRSTVGAIIKKLKKGYVATDEGDGSRRFWSEVDPATEPAHLCLTAMEEGLFQVIELAGRTPLRKKLVALQALFLGMARRLRAGDFKPEVPVAQPVRPPLQTESA